MNCRKNLGILDVFQRCINATFEAQPWSHRYIPVGIMILRSSVKNYIVLAPRKWIQAYASLWYTCIYIIIYTLFSQMHAAAQHMSTDSLLVCRTVDARAYFINASRIMQVCAIGTVCMAVSLKILYAEFEDRETAGYAVAAP